MIPQRFLEIVKECTDKRHQHFPATEVFNEGWLLRLVLDAVKSSTIPDHPLHFLDKATWYSEARLVSPFLRKPKHLLPVGMKDTLAEGYTCADGVIGHFSIEEGRKARLALDQHARQFVVVEAKLMSPLSSKITHVAGYNQAARTIACMAETIRRSGLQVADLESVGFYVVAPKKQLEKQGQRNISTYLARNLVNKAVHARFQDYETAYGSDAIRQKCKVYVNNLLERLFDEDKLKCVSWESILEPINDRSLESFYKSCLEFARRLPGPNAEDVKGEKRQLNNGQLRKTSTA